MCVVAFLCGFWLLDRFDWFGLRCCGMTYGVLLYIVMDWLCWLVGSALIVCCTIGGSQPCSAWCTEASTMDRFFFFGLRLVLHSVLCGCFGLINCDVVCGLFALWFGCSTSYSSIG